MMEKLMGSLRSRMTVLFGLIVLIGCLVLMFVSGNRAGSALEDEAKQAMSKLIKQAVETVEGWVKARFYVVESTANQSAVRGRWEDREATLEEKLAVLRDTLQAAESLGFKQLGIVDREGNVVFSDGSKSRISEQSCFQAALKGRTAVSSTIVSREDNSVVFAFVSPVRDYTTGEIRGALLGIVDAASFSELVTGITYGRTGYAFAVDSTGKTLAHKDTTKVLTEESMLKLAGSDPAMASVRSAISRMAEGEEGVTTYNYQGQDKIIAYSPVEGTDWSLAVTAPVSEVLERTTSLKRSMLIISVVIILVALILTYVMARTITTPLVLTVDLLGLIANGDFTGSVPDKFLRRQDEIGTLARAVDRLQASIKPLLSGIKEEAKMLAGNSENLSAASEEIASSSGEVARTIQQVAAGASEQAGHLQEILELMENITTSLEKVYRELGNVKASSEKTSRLAGVGKEELDVLVASINGVRQTFRVAAEKLTDLSGSVNQVSEILEVINNIADQTNLLALNAAIEAARAGDAGRGFAVVAEEVRKLAEQSRASSDKIRLLLGTIASETGEVMSTSEEVGRQVEAQLENVENTIRSFDNILDAVAAMEPVIEETYRHVESTVKAKDVVLERVKSISAVSEETSAAAQEISASAEELSASTEGIAASAQEVLRAAKSLEEQVERFKV
ncbi:MAG: methyl-accepting chemotaxis protein [Firmicutes bacterium]|nr:methyl-accepting chemotaxis protein [Bacillota bacterium]